MWLPPVYVSVVRETSCLRKRGEVPMLDIDTSRCRNCYVYVNP